MEMNHEVGVELLLLIFSKLKVHTCSEHCTIKATFVGRKVKTKFVSKQRSSNNHQCARVVQTKTVDVDYGKKFLIIQKTFGTNNHNLILKKDVTCIQMQLKITYEKEYSLLDQTNGALIWYPYITLINVCKCYM